MAESSGRRYWEALKAVLEPLVASQLEPIQRAAGVVVRALGSGHRLYVYDTGHMLNRELVNRAGGLIAMTPLAFDLAVENTIAHEAQRPRPVPTEDEVHAYVGYALTQTGIQPGDVVIVASVTGARILPVEVVLQLQARDVHVIGLTSLEYSRFAPVQHSSGKKLMDLCEVVIDNHCVVGDSILAMAGLDERIGPTSGISAAVLMWMLCAEIVDRQITQGRSPCVLESMNLPGANDRNHAKALAYLATVHHNNV